MADHGVLTVEVAVRLGELLSATQRGTKVARWVPAVEDVVWGTARSVGDERGMFLGAGEDVRDSYLRVTSSAGWEYFWPVSELIEDMRAGAFVTDYKP